MSRRRRAVAEFTVATALLALIERFRRRMGEDHPEWRSPWTAGGVLTAVAYGWANDADWRGVRTSRRRRVAFSALQTTAGRLAFGGREAARGEFGLGQLAGLALYRLRYGVLGPLPGADE